MAGFEEPRPRPVPSRKVLAEDAPERGDHDCGSQSPFGKFVHAWCGRRGAPGNATLTGNPALKGVCRVDSHAHGGGIARWCKLALDLLDGRLLPSLAELVLGLGDLGAELAQATVALLRRQIRELLGLFDKPGARASGR